MPEAFTVAIVLKELYFLLYPDKLNITGYRLSLVPSKGSRTSKRLVCSTVWYYLVSISPSPSL